MKTTDGFDEQDYVAQLKKMDARELVSRLCDRSMAIERLETVDVSDQDQWRISRRMLEHLKAETTKRINIGAWALESMRRCLIAFAGIPCHCEIGKECVSCSIKRMAEELER